jgi:hypothetical protein
MDVQEDFGENERDQDNGHGGEMALRGFNCQAANRPHHLMINRWCCEATLGSGDIGSGCYFSMLAISLGLGIPTNKEHLLDGTSLGFEYMKQGKYISGYEMLGTSGKTCHPRNVKFDKFREMSFQDD